MYRSTMNTNVITALGMCKVCTEAIHSVARKRQDWTCESTCEHENAKTRKRENGRNQPVDAKTRKRRKRENGENKKTAKTGKTRKRENGENPKTRKRENGENDENPKTAKSVPVFWFSISRFLVFSVFWFSRFLVFSFRWPHPSGQVAFFMCLVPWFTTGFYTCCDRPDFLLPSTVAQKASGRKKQMFTNFMSQTHGFEKRSNLLVYHKIIQKNTRCPSFLMVISPIFWRPKTFIFSIGFLGGPKEVDTSVNSHHQSWCQ